MTENDTNRVLYSSLGAKFWCPLPLQLDSLFEIYLSKWCGMLLSALLSTCLIFKAVIYWFTVSQSGCNWKFFMGQSHMTPKTDQPQLSNLVQHAEGNSCSIHCKNEQLLNTLITAASYSESGSIKNIYKNCAIANGDSFSNYIINLRGNWPVQQTCGL